jgi:predicted DNA binding protein
LAQPFTGKWRFEENGYRIILEITKDNHNLCRYLFQTKKIDKDEWVDDDIGVTRYRFKQIDNKTIMEEYNARTHVLSVNEITLVNDNELRVKAIENEKINVFHKVE